MQMAQDVTSLVLALRRKVNIKAVSYTHLYQNGWDTDQFPIDNYELTQAMMQIIRNGGFGDGGTNFDAKTRRNSTDVYKRQSCKRVTASVSTSLLLIDTFMFLFLLNKTMEVNTKKYR